MLQLYKNPAGRRIETQELTLRSENLQLKAANKTPKMVEEVPLKAVEEVD
jgi:hypothetical protein